MDLLGLDKNFNAVTYIPFINLQWNRRYYEWGTWTVQIAANDYDPNVAFVYSPERPELGMVERMESQDTIKGRFVLLSGRFMEHIFERQVAYPEITGGMSVASLANMMVTHGWYKPDVYTIVPDPNNPSDHVDVKWERQAIGKLFYETLQTRELSPRIAFDPTTHQLTLKIWRGLDRTQSQNQNAYVLFSEDSCYVSSISYIEDWSGYKNSAMMLYGDSDSPSRHDEYILPDAEAVAEGRRWVIMNSSEEESNAAMAQEGQEELQRYPVVRQAEIKIIQNGLFYLTDYDLGDKCDLVSHEFQKSFEARIIGANEVWKNGEHGVTLMIGEQTKTSYEKMKRYADTQNKGRKAASGGVTIQSITNEELEALLK